jgi:aspartate/methionine/tyrosine aminotransferase
VRIPERIAAIEPFLAMEVLERAHAMERDGAKVIHLEIGEPDFAAPAAAVEAARRALAAGAARYTDSRGLPELRAAIAADKARRTGVPVDPEQVLVTSGTSPALLLVFSLLVEPGDEVIVPAPHYPCYPNFVRFCGGTPVSVPCDPAAGWRVDPAAVRRAVGPRTRAVVIGSPANPTGAVQPREVMAALASLGVPLVSDEVYDGLVYDGAHATSALEVSGPEPGFVLDGFSKRYAMTGFRLGYVIAPRGAMRTLQILAQNLFISAAEFVQHAGLAALAHGAPTVETMRAAYARRRDLLVGGLRALGLGVAAAPRGAFYVLADARRFDPDSRRLAARLLEEAHVAVTPGVDFGAAGEGFLRFCYAASEDALREALVRMRRVLR